MKMDVLINIFGMFQISVIRYLFLVYAGLYVDLFEKKRFSDSEKYKI